MLLIGKAQVSVETLYSLKAITVMITKIHPSGPIVIV